MSQFGVDAVDLSVILAAHGAGDGSAANARVHSLAQRLERSMLGARVHASFRRGTPSHVDAMRELNGGRGVLVPVLTSEGYHARAIRELVRATPEAAGVIVAEVLGASCGITDAVIVHVKGALLKHRIDAQSCVVLVVGHGTPRDVGSRLTTNAVARALSAATGAAARAGFIDDTPGIEAALGSAPPGSALVVFPWLLGGGPHALADVPDRVAHAVDVLRRWGTVISLDPLGDLEVVGAAIEEAVRRTVGPSSLPPAFLGDGIEEA